MVEIIEFMLAAWIAAVIGLAIIGVQLLAQQDRREADMRRHPSVRPLDDFDQHADDAVNLITADHQELADFAAWERDLRGVQ